MSSTRPATHPAQASSIAPGTARSTGRWAEVGLLIVALVLGLGGFVLTALNRTGSSPAQILQLGGLEGHGAQMDPDPGAIDALPQTGDEGKHEEGEAPPHGPAVPTAQQAVVAHDEYGAEQHDADAGPHGLLGGVVVGLLQALVGQVQSLDHGQPEPSTPPEAMPNRPITNCHEPPCAS